MAKAETMAKAEIMAKAEVETKTQEQPKLVYSVVSEEYFGGGAKFHRVFDSLERAKEYADLESTEIGVECAIYAMEVNGSAIILEIPKVSNIPKVPKIKVVVVGDGGVGKTAFIRRHLTGEFEKRYISTKGVEVIPIAFNTNKGPVILNVWDCGDIHDSYFEGAQAFIIMFDMTSHTSYRNAACWARHVLEYLRSVGQGDYNMVLCGNKVDIFERAVQLEEITLHQTLQCQYYEVSAKSNYNYEKPFLHIIRKIMGEDTNLIENS